MFPGCLASVYQGTIRSKMAEFAPLLRYFHSAYALTLTEDNAENRRIYRAEAYCPLYADASLSRSLLVLSFT